jgi:hypothetical protein
MMRPAVREFNATLKCYSMGVAGKEEREVGDKIILPSSSFIVIARLQLPLPLYFTVDRRGLRPNGNIFACAIAPQHSLTTLRHPSASDSKSASVAASSSPAKEKGAGGPQYCGVLEFSAPDDTVYIPHWQMSNLSITEGAQVVVRSVSPGTLSKGKEAVFQPHDQQFVELLKELGTLQLHVLSFERLR